MDMFFRFHGLLDNNSNHNSSRTSRDGIKTTSMFTWSIDRILSCSKLPDDPFGHLSLRDFNRFPVSIARVEYMGLKICLKRILAKEPASALVELASDFARMRETQVQLCKHDKIFMFYLVRAFLQLVNEVPQKVMSSLLAGNSNLNPMLLASLRFAMQPEVLARNTPWLQMYASKPECVQFLPIDWSTLKLEKVPELTHFFTRIRCGRGDYMFGQFANCLLYAVAKAKNHLSSEPVRVFQSRWDVTPQSS